MKGFARLSFFVRPGLNKAGGFALRPGSQPLPSPPASHQLKILERASARLSVEKSEAHDELRVSVNRFRTAFEGGASSQKILDRAWQVQRAWNKLRNVEDSLLMLSKEREILDIISGDGLGMAGKTASERGTSAVA